MPCSSQFLYAVCKFNPAAIPYAVSSHRNHTLYSKMGWGFGLPHFKSCKTRRCTSQLCHSLVQVMLFHIISLEILREQANCFILNQHCWFCSMFYRWSTCQTMACCRLFGASKQRAIRHQNGLLESPYLDHQRLHRPRRLARSISKTFSNGSLNHPWNRH